MLQYLIITIFTLFLISLFYFKKFWAILFQVSIRCWFSILTNVLAIIFLVGTAQGKDIITEVDFFKSGIRSFTSLFFLWMWAYNCMNLAQITLELNRTYKLSGKVDELSNAIVLIVPGLLGLFPFISAVTVISVNQEQPDSIILSMLIIETWFFLLFLLFRRNKPVILGSIKISGKILNLISLYVFKIYFYIRNFINFSFNFLFNKKDETQKESPLSKPGVKGHIQKYMNGVQFLNWSGHFILYLLIAIYPIYFSNFFGSIGLLFIALSFFCLVGIVFADMRELTRVPLFPFIVITVLVFTMVNENNKSGIIQTQNKDTRQELNIHFNNWFKERAMENDTVQISLVAAEGGGLRSAYWTYGVLRQLQLDNPEFLNQLYAISSVSGGGVGAALYCTEQFTGLSKEISDAPIINDDNLAPMIGSLLYREIIQSIIPFGLKMLDRSRTMNKTFESNWKVKYPYYPLWDKNLLDVWNENNSLPVVFFNTTKVESGESAIFSTVAFDSSQIHSIDMMKHIQEQPSVSEVVGLSARFMYLQPAGRYDYVNGKTWGHLVDGGYYDNSGLSTVFQLYISLRKQADSLINEGIAVSAKINIIFLRNGKHVHSDPENSFLNEINTPLKTLLNSWYSRMYSFEHIVKSTMPKVNQNDQLYEIKLDREETPLPLGWLFSEKSKNEMRRQLQLLHDDENYNQVRKSIKNK